MLRINRSLVKPLAMFRNHVCMERQSPTTPAPKNLPPENSADTDADKDKDPVDEAGEESFPASDAPSWTTAIVHEPR